MNSSVKRHPVHPTLQNQIDEIIDFYEAHKPGAGMRIPVYATPRQLAKAIGRALPDNPPKDYIEPREIEYRGRVLIAVGEPNL